VSRGRGPGPALECPSRPRPTVTRGSYGSGQTKLESLMKRYRVEEQRTGGIRMVREQPEDHQCELAHRRRHFAWWWQDPCLDHGQVGTKRCDASQEPPQQGLSGGMLVSAGAHGTKRGMKAESASDQTLEEPAEDGCAMLAARDAGRGQQRNRASRGAADQPLNLDPLRGLRVRLQCRPLVVAVPAQSMAVQAERAAQRLGSEQRARFENVGLDSAAAGA